MNPHKPRLNLPMSALISGLLVAPTFGGVAPPVLPRMPAAVQTSSSVAFPARMPAEVADRLRRWVKGEPLDAQGMQNLHRRMTADAQERIAQAIAAATGGKTPLRTVQLSVWNSGDATVLPLPRMENVAFLGVATSPLAQGQGEMLNLPRGVGLVVDFVDADSPAAAAGLRPGDILHKLEDQWVINTQQLAVLVRARKPGDQVALSVIRDRVPLTLSVTLVDKQVAVSEQPQILDPRRVIPGGDGAPARPAPAGTIITDNTLGAASSAAAGAEGVARSSLSTSTAVQADGSSTKRRVDDRHDITLMRSAAGHETLLVKDRAGKTIYDGAVEKAELPAEIAAKVEQLRQKPAEVRIRIGNPADPSAEPNAVTSRSAVMTRTDGQNVISLSLDGDVRRVNVMRTDDQHVISLSLDGDARRLNVKDHTGKTLYDGPANSDEDIKALAPDVAEKVRTMIEKLR